MTPSYGSDVRFWFSFWPSHSENADMPQLKNNEREHLEECSHQEVRKRDSMDYCSNPFIDRAWAWGSFSSVMICRWVTGPGMAKAIQVTQAWLEHYLSGPKEK